MLFPLSIIEPCLEKAGVPIEVPPDWAPEFCSITN